MALIIRKCFNQRSLYNIFGKDNRVKLKKTVYNVTYLKYKYHTTPVYFKGLPKRMNPVMVNYKKLLLKKSIPIWKNMTVTDLAIVTKESRESIIQMLSEIDGKPYEPYSVLSELDIPIQLAKKFDRDWNDITGHAKVINIHDIKNCEIEDILKRNPPDPSVLVKRHPIITIMGHVDHGKTTLLDALRKSSVVDSEFGGITQHIGAFNVTLSNNEKITFLDTPGHAAFNAMRERGANVTDIVILVVAADDGVMEQTIESIKMADEAHVPIIVAVNKIDKPEADIYKTLCTLANHGVIVEELGGNVQSVNISARKQTNLNELIDVIWAQAEILELKGDPVGFVEGAIIESTSNVYLGKIASMAIKRGTLKKGHILVSGQSWARVKSIMDHTGAKLSTAQLSDVVQVTGWNSLPIVGEKVYQVENERKAQALLKRVQATISKQQSLEQKKAADEKYVNHLLHYKECIEKMAGGKSKSVLASSDKFTDASEAFIKLNVIIKGDVAGSVEAILDVINTYHDKRCLLMVVTYGVGAVTATDIDLAETFNAVIYCFNTMVPNNLLEEIEKKKVEVSQFNVIYKLVDDLKYRLTKKLKKEQVEQEFGRGIILKVYEVSEKKKKIPVAGIRCTDGSLKKNARFKIWRENNVIYDDNISEMRHLKNSVDNLALNMEGGLKLKTDDVKLKPNDIIICYNFIEHIPTIDWNTGF